MSAVAVVARFGLLGAALALVYVCYTKLSENRQQTCTTSNRQTASSSRSNQSGKSCPPPQPGDSCPICLGDYSPPLEMLPCKHLFHRQCLRTWFKHQWFCPICTLEIEDCDRPEYLERLNLR